MTTDTTIDLPDLPSTYTAGSFAPGVPVYDAGQLRAYAIAAITAFQQQEAVAWQSLWSDGTWHEINRATYSAAVANGGWVKAAGGEVKMTVRALVAAAPAAQDDGHPDDRAVDAFAAAMKVKLARKRSEGRGGWQDKAQCTQELLSQLLHDHAAKGDPVDVANLAMMLHQRGEVILPAAPSAQDAEVSPEFTDTARAAIAWVLYHHQGSNSPVGQPLRFALGMGRHEPLSKQRVIDARRYGAWAGAQTSDFHEHTQAVEPERFGEAIRWLRAALDCQQFKWDADQWELADSECRLALSLIEHTKPRPVPLPMEGDLEQEAALLSGSAAAGVPDGYVLVPKQTLQSIRYSSSDPNARGFAAGALATDSEQWAATVAAEANDTMVDRVIDALGRAGLQPPDRPRVQLILRAALADGEQQAAPASQDEEAAAQERAYFARWADEFPVPAEQHGAGSVVRMAGQYYEVRYASTGEVIREFPSCDYAYASYFSQGYNAALAARPPAGQGISSATPSETADASYDIACATIRTLRAGIQEVAAAIEGSATPVVQYSDQDLERLASVVAGRLAPDADLSI